MILCTLALLLCTQFLHATELPTPCTKGQKISVVQQDADYAIFTESSTYLTDHPQYCIEHDTITPIADGYERTIVAVRPGDYRLFGIPLYKEEITITHTHTTQSSVRTIKTRLIHENGNMLLLIAALGLAGIVYKIAQDVRQTYASTHQL